MSGRPESRWHAGPLLSSGFTLIELMVVLAMVAVLATIAAPALQSLVKSNQTANLANEFVMGTAFARAQAVGRNQCVTMCIASDMSAATPVCRKTATEWNAGWIIFANNKCDGAAADATAELLKVYLGDPAGPSLNDASGGTSPGAILFNARGMTTLTAKSLPVVPAGGSTATRVICLDAAGRGRVGKPGSIVCGTNLN